MTTTPTPLQVSLKLHKSIRAAKAAGWTLVRRRFLQLEQKKCCGLSTLTLTEKKDLAQAADILGVSSAIIWSIVHGWDSCTGENTIPEASEYQPQWFALGHRLANKFVK